MRNSSIKEYQIILIIVAVAAVIGLFISNYHRAELKVVYPEKNITLTEQDFTIKTNNGILQVGNSSFNEVQNIIADGKILGMSTVYKPKKLDCYLTFTEDEDILHKMHINTPSLSTYRGVKVGDNFSNAIEKYGKNYAYVELSDESGDFDAVYGDEDNIVFQVRENNIVKIVLQKEYTTN